MEDGGEVELIRKAVSLSLPPPHVVEELLSIGVCARCLFRLFGAQENVYSSSLLSESMLYSIIEELKDSKSASNDNISSSHSSSNEDNCSICLGMLQFVVCSDQEKIGNRSKRTACLEDFTKEVAEIVRREGYEIDSFSIEISVPPVTLANERAFWLYMKKMYGDKKLFEEWFHKDKISIKDALKLSVTELLQNHLNTKFNIGSFRIRLAYTHFDASGKLQRLLGEELGCKKRKFGQDKNHIFGAGVGHENGVVQDSNISTQKEHIEHVKNVSDAVIHKALEGLTDHVFSECFALPLQKVSEPCNFTIVCYRTPIYIGGRYLKFSRRVSQSRWIIDDERMGEASVEEIIGSSVILKCRGDSYKFHAAGREDIDVRMLGSGRPFLVEVSNARIMPSPISVQEIVDDINNSKDKYVAVQKLKVLGIEVWDMMREGEAEKQKQYAALVWISRPLTEGDVLKLSSAEDLEIMQKTPVRVLHRRSPLERKRIIHWMRTEKIAGNSQYFLLHLCTQAGTYIKEFVHGDLGRTHPSIGSLLGCRAEILQLDVTDVKMNSFD